MRLEKGETYDHAKYDDVQITGFGRRINAIDADGEAEDTLVVKYTISPGEQFMTERELKEEPYDEFHEAVSGE